METVPIWEVEDERQTIEVDVDVDANGKVIVRHVCMYLPYLPPDLCSYETSLIHNQLTPFVI